MLIPKNRLLCACLIAICSDLGGLANLIAVIAPPPAAPKTVIYITVQVVQAVHLVTP
ncbi:hypothetical protein SAMN05444506_12231 [Pseudomonas syringae]|nr:hypothetical protein ALQ58_200449 [Pseudomonas syringae pv. apii]SDZ49442.1 hypothetical protein SAMN05444506_12231 [Pseudomonas syringae]